MARRGNTSFTKTQDTLEIRIEKWRKYRMFILVVCEDQNTEPTYIRTFEHLFPEHTLYLKVAGVGKDPLGVVLSAVEKCKELSGFTKRDIDEVWVVFDKDDADLNQTRIDRFNSAFTIANKNNFKIAWSNEVFELWLLLHFVEVDPTKPLPRLEVYNCLKDSINHLVGTEVIIDGHSNIEILRYLQSHGSEENAILRAETLQRHHIKTPALAANPATMMHLLIKTLREWINYYNYVPSL